MTEQQRRYLLGHRVGHLATAGGDGAPHVIPVCYALDAVGNVYFVADQKPKRGPAREILRLRNLRQNPRAALVVDDYDEDWRRLAWVMVRGSAAVVAPADHAPALALLRERYPQYREMELSVDHNPIVRIRPEKVTGWSFSAPDGSKA